MERRLEKNVEKAKLTKQFLFFKLGINVSKMHFALEGTHYLISKDGVLRLFLENSAFFGTLRNAKMELLSNVVCWNIYCSLCMFSLFPYELLFGTVCTIQQYFVPGHVFDNIISC